MNEAGSVFFVVVFFLLQRSEGGGRGTHKGGKEKQQRKTERRNLNSFPRCGLRAGLEKLASEPFYTRMQPHCYTHTQ